MYSDLSLRFIKEVAITLKVNMKLCSIFSYYIPINDTSIELSVFWLSYTENQINELRFTDSVSLSFILTSVTCFCDDVA